MEQDRLDLQHNIYLLMLDGRLNLAPIEEMKGGIHNVLDIATGTGIWAIDFGMICFKLFTSAPPTLFSRVFQPLYLGFDYGRPLSLRYHLL